MDEGYGRTHNGYEFSSRHILPLEAQMVRHAASNKPLQGQCLVGLPITGTHGSRESSNSMGCKPLNLTEPCEKTWKVALQRLVVSI